MPIRLRLDRIVFLGPDNEPASVQFDQRLTVVCGASDTGKSFLVEALDFGLGRSTPPARYPSKGWLRSVAASDRRSWQPANVDFGAQFVGRWI